MMAWVEQVAALAWSNISGTWNSQATTWDNWGAITESADAWTAQTETAPAWTEQ